MNTNLFESKSKCENGGVLATCICVYMSLLGSERRPCVLQCTYATYLQKVAHFVAAMLAPVAVAIAVVMGKLCACVSVCCTVGTAPNKARKT